MRVGRRTDVVPEVRRRSRVTPRAVRLRPLGGRGWRRRRRLAVEVVRCGLHGRLVRRDLALAASRTAPWRAARARAPPGGPSRGRPLVLALRGRRCRRPPLGGGRLAVLGERRRRARAARRSGRGAAVAASSLGDAAGLADRERRAQRCRDEPEHACRPARGTRRARDPPTRSPRSEIWVARWSAPSAPSASAITRVRVRIGRPDGRPEPGAGHRGPGPRSAAGRYHSDPPVEQRGAERRAVEVARADDEHREHLGSHIAPPSSTARPTTRAARRRIGFPYRSLEGVQCAYSGSRTAPSSTSGAVASARSPALGVDVDTAERRALARRRRARRPSSRAHGERVIGVRDARHATLPCSSTIRGRSGARSASSGTSSTSTRSRSRSRPPRSCCCARFAAAAAALRSCSTPRRTCASATPCRSGGSSAGRSRAASGISACNAEAARIVEDEGIRGAGAGDPARHRHERFRPADVAGAELPADPRRSRKRGTRRMPRRPRSAPTARRSSSASSAGSCPRRACSCSSTPSRVTRRLHLRIGGLRTARTTSSASAPPRRGIADRVEFVGPVDPDDVVDFYRTLDVLAVPSLPTPSWTEQFGRVAVEAMACGVPVVSSDAGALPDVVGGAGIVVPAGDAAALAGALRRGGRHPRRRAPGERARARRGVQLGGRGPRLPRPVPIGRARGIRPARPASRSSSSPTAHPTLLRRALEPVAGLPVTVVDNSSLPEIAALCAELGVRYLDPGRNGGFAAGVNVALRDRLVPGADVLLLNPDAVDLGRRHRRAAARAARRAATSRASARRRSTSTAGRRASTGGFPSPGGTWLEALGLARLRRGPDVRDRLGAAAARRGARRRSAGSTSASSSTPRRPTGRTARTGSAGATRRCPRRAPLHVGAGTSGDRARREAHFHASQERYLRKHYGALGWQWARLGQWLGAMARAIAAARRARARGPPARGAVPARAGRRVEAHGSGRAATAPA